MCFFHAWLPHNNKSLSNMCRRKCALNPACMRAHMLCVCVRLLSFLSDVNSRFYFQWIIYLCSSLGTCTGQGSESMCHPHLTCSYAHAWTHTVQQHTTVENYTTEAAINIYTSPASYLFHPAELISEGQRDGEDIQRGKEVTEGK